MIAPGPNNLYFRTVRVFVYGWVLALVLALYPYTEDPAGPVKLLASAVAAVAMAAVWAAGVAAGRAPFRRLHGVFYVLLGFLGAQCASALFSWAPGIGLRALQPWYIYTLIAFLVYQVFPEPRHLRNLFRAIVCGVTLSSVYAVLQRVGLDPFPWADRTIEEYRGLPSTYGSPNFAGHALVIALVLCAGLAGDAFQRGKRGLEPFVCAAAGGLMLLHLYWTGMRGGAVALALAAIFAGVCDIQLRRGATPLRAGTSGALTAGVVLAICGAAGILLAPRLGLDSSLQLRLNGYAGAVAMIGDQPLLGVGPGNYARFNVDYWTDFEPLWYALEGKRNFHAHNEWLEVAAESGLTGLAAFILLFLAAVATPFANPAFVTAKHRALLVAAPASVIAMGADACTGFNLHVPVSGALFFVLVAAQPGSASAPVVRGFARILPPVLAVLGIFYAAAAWNGFQAARLYQRAQGAMAWEREAQLSGQNTLAGRGAAVAGECLAAARARAPWDPAIRMLQGDLALAEGHYEDAYDAYGFAAALGPDLPRIEVQKARCRLRLVDAPSGATREMLLGIAERHARSARDRCPALADAWAMLGWVAFRRAEPLGAEQASRLLDEAVDAFETARRLGLAADTNLDAALCQAYGRQQNWPAAAAAGERCAMAAVENPGYWDLFARAAAEAGGAWPARYRQALVYQLGQIARRQKRATPRATVALAARLVEIPAVRGANDLCLETVRGVLEVYSGELGLWSAWLGYTDGPEQGAALRAGIRELHGPGGATVPEPLRTLEDALDAPDAASLEGASRGILGAIATAPSGERSGPEARIYIPVIMLVERLMIEREIPHLLLGETLGDLGAAYFEAGAPGRADALLEEATRVAPPADSGRAWYYRSRLLAAGGQPEAALALAQQAVKVNGGSVEYRWQLARCLSATGRPEAAAFLYESLSSSIPPDHPYRAPLASALAAVREQSGGASP